MNSNLTSSLSDFSKGRTGVEPSGKPPRGPILWNPITSMRRWLGKLLSFSVARVLMIFFLGFAAGIVWQSYSGAARNAIAGWSPRLAWLAPTAAPGSISSDRIKTASLALAAARQSLDKVATEIGKMRQDGDAPRRRTAR